MNSSNPIAAARGARRAATWAAALLLLVSTALPASAAGTPGALTGVVNVNTATSEELQLLPGVGRSRATAILEMRKARGRFGSVDELMEVKGIGPSMLERMRPHVSLDGRTTARPAAKPATRKASKK